MIKNYIAFNILDQDYNVLQAITLEGLNLPSQNVTRKVVSRAPRVMYNGVSQPVIHKLGYEESDLEFIGTFTDRVGTSSNVSGKARVLADAFDNLLKTQNTVLLQYSVQNSKQYIRYGMVKEFSQTPDPVYGDSRIDYKIVFLIESLNKPFSEFGKRQSKATIDYAMLRSIDTKTTTLIELEGIVASDSLSSKVLSGIRSAKKAMYEANKAIQDVKSKIDSSRETLLSLSSKLTGFINNIADARQSFDLLRSDVSKGVASIRLGSLVARVDAVMSDGAQSLIDVQLALLKKLRGDGVKKMEYLVKAGDTWTSISLSQLGSSSAWPRLQRENPTVDSLTAGLRIMIPK
jgi:hypothetical protein